MHMKYNNEFKHIDTEQKAFFLGYMFGDGTITSFKNKKCNTFVLRTTIVSKDEDIITKFKNIFPFFKKYQAKKGYFILTSTDKTLFSHLEENGLFKRKSFENKNFLRLPKLSDELICHFIRGFYDADGGYYIYNNNVLETFCCSVSEPFINDIKDWFLSKNIKLNKTSRKRENFQELFYLRTKSSTKAILFKNLIFINATIFLNRKKEVVDSALNFSKEDAISRSISTKKGTEKQFKLLMSNCPNIVEQYKFIKKIENPSLCCNYHTIQNSGYTQQKYGRKPFNTCLKCGKRSIHTRLTLNWVN